jgi:hypothetical protein
MGRSPADDHDQLRRLSSEYAAAVDRRDEGRLLTVFHPDAELIVHRADGSQPPSRLHGHDEIRVIVERIARYPKTFHLLGQSAYEIEGDQALGEVHCVAHHFDSGHVGVGTDHVMFVRYRDDYRLDARDEWRIAARTVLVDATVVQPVTAEQP